MHRDAPALPFVVLIYLDAHDSRDQLAKGERAITAVVEAGQSGNGPAVERSRALSDDPRFDEH